MQNCVLEIKFTERKKGERKERNGEERCFLINGKNLGDDSLPRIKGGFSYKHILLRSSLWSYCSPPYILLQKWG